MTSYLWQTKNRGNLTETPLGADFLEALRKYADLDISNSSPVVTFGEVARQYLVNELPTKAHSTQNDIRWSLKQLLEFFDQPAAPLAKIKPIHIRHYLDWRGKSAPIRANREIAWFSAIWNYARNRGFTDLPNPCSGINRHKEEGRETYINDDEFMALYQAGGESLRNAMDLAYLTAQRVADVLKMRETDIRDGAIEVKQNKTKAKLRITSEGALDSLLRRCREVKERHSVHSLSILTNHRGQALTKAMLRGRFEKARARAAESAENDELRSSLLAIQFRDLRAKAATDKADFAGDIRQAQKQLGHTSLSMTEHYIRRRR